MGEVVRYMGTSAARDRRKERHFVAVAQDGVASRVLAIDRGGRHERESAKEIDLAAERLPEVPDPRSLREVALFLVPAGGLPERRKVKKANAHGQPVYAGRHEAT